MQEHVIVPNRTLTIGNFSSEDECAYYIRLSEDIGFDAASVTTKSGQAMHPELSSLV
jgi:hypothetical protein